MLNISDRFERKYMPVPESGCWVWTGAVMTKDGYGRFWDGDKVRNAHRVSYEMVNGPIPEGSDIDHLCRVRCCVNPSHLEAVSRQINLLRGVGFPAIHNQRTYCPQGHPYEGLNNINEKDRGYIKRRCRICRNARQAAYNLRTRKGETKCWLDFLK